ncbi:hypothetical protein [Chamaesiphon minutus]|uniref:Uncharacterized protein n=1 Tax=Chamaesiphon minutus (strain ATCC 27169 / PCC 6605) TaxID=1173020 RepID=K9UCK0_CHAP6|nr:hypothetical protein [Chamaesiphon minutus]AFY92171.1 hypothetical protein Cha6605_0913 [Chamaesiphon minutus PCC 6605]
MVKAIRIPFLEKAVVSKFDFHFSMLLDLKKICNDDLIDKTIIRPALISQLHEANLNQLISLRTKKDIFNEDQIEPHLLDKLKNASLRELLILSSFDNNILDDFVNSQIRINIAGAKLIDLFRAASIMLYDLQGERIKIGCNSIDQN